MRGCGWDAHRVFDIAVPLFPVGRGWHTVVRHQPDGMVDGVDKDAHILDHGDAVSARGGSIEHLLNVQVGLPGIHPPLGNGDKGFAPPVLGQAQDSPGVALGQAIVQHELPGEV